MKRTFGGKAAKIAEQTAPFKAVVAMDSFKGTMTSEEACRMAALGILDVFPNARVEEVPVADGGEGTMAAFFVSLGGEYVPVETTDPYGNSLTAPYLFLPDQGLAVVETAAASGLTLSDRREPAVASTYGTGQQLAAVLKAGCRKIFLGLGGSATNDGGAGILAALGVRFLDARGEVFVPTGGTLGEVEKIETHGLLPEVRETEITLLCDVKNPLCGPRGASAVYGPQKGADSCLVEVLDRNLRHFAQKVRETTGEEIDSFPGGGAAGGICAGLKGFFGVEIRSGIEMLLETVNFSDHVRDADLVITGEGRVDAQSAYGKVPAGVAAAASAAGVPCFVLAGDVGDGYETVLERGITAVLSINHLAKPYREVRDRAPLDLRDTAANLVRVRYR